jgi:Asp-tRNA(Asn)/Glu-tRNA(Gln) amidotransferase A subunit family amidase
MPTVSVPADTSPDGLPLGLQLAAPQGADERLLRWAARIEEALE